MPTATRSTPGSCGDAPDGFLVEDRDLVGRPLERQDRHVQREHVVRVEAGVRALQRQQRREQHPGAGQQHERRGDLRDGEQPQPPVRAGGDPQAAAREAEAAGRRRRTAAAARTPAAPPPPAPAPTPDPQHARVHGEIERANREARRVARRAPRPSAARSPRRGCAPAPHSTQALGQQRAPQRAGAGPERRADRELPFTPHRARQDQVGDVRARDDEHQRRGGEQHQQHRPRRRRDLVAQADGVDPEIRVRRIRLGMLLDDRAVHRAQLGARRRRDPTPGASRPNSSVIRCTRPSTIVASRWCGLVTTLAMISVSAGYGTDGSSTPTIVAVRSPSRTVLPTTDGSLAERRRPEAMGQHRRAGRLRPIVGRTEQPAEHRAQPHDVEVRAADHAGADDARLAEADHRELDGREVAERASSVLTRACRSRISGTEKLAFSTAEAGRALADVDQPVLVAVDERPQQDAAHDAEDRGVGADAERQGDDDGDGQPLDPGQRPQGETEIGVEAHTNPLRVRRHFSRRGPWPKPPLNS